MLTSRHTPYAVTLVQNTAQCSVSIAIALTNQ